MKEVEFRIQPPHPLMNSPDSASSSVSTRLLQDHLPSGHAVLPTLRPRRTGLSPPRPNPDQAATSGPNPEAGADPAQRFGRSGPVSFEVSDHTALVGPALPGSSLCARESPISAPPAGGLPGDGPSAPAMHGLPAVTP